jgi:transposase-like protein
MRKILRTIVVMKLCKMERQLEALDLYLSGVSMSEVVRKTGVKRQFVVSFIEKIYTEMLPGQRITALEIIKRFVRKIRETNLKTNRYRCVYCDKTFRDLKRLRIHYHKNHKEELDLIWRKILYQQLYSTASIDF